MHSTITELEGVLLPALCFSAQVFRVGIGQRVQRTWQRAAQTLHNDWRGTRALSYGLVLLLSTIAFIGVYYLNHPQPEIFPDSPTYFQVTQQILAHGKFVDVLRTPGYPTFIALIFLVAGGANLTAVSIAQGILFLGATLELYLLTFLLFRRAWIALLVGLLLGTNTYLIGFVKPLLSEGMGLWLVASLALLVVLFLQRWQLRYLWLLTLCTLLLFMTRPEWIYLPVPLFIYLWFIAWRRGKLRRLLPQSVLALVLLYAFLGGYAYANGVQNGFFGVTDNQNGNLLGKILQYRMQNEAPPQYAQVAAIVNAYVEQGGIDPNVLARIYPPLVENHWALAGAYSQAIISHHPIEFLVDTVRVFFTSSLGPPYSYSPISAQGLLGRPLFWLQSLSFRIYESYVFFPLFALFWIILLFRRRTARLAVAEEMGAVVLLALYGLTLTAVGGYVDYMRLHIPFDPLFLLVIVSTSLASLPLCMSFLAQHRWHWRTAGLIAGALLLGAVAASIVGSLLIGGLKRAFDPQTWLVVHLLVNHPLWALVGLAGVGGFIWLAYQAQPAAIRSAPGAKRIEQTAALDAQQALLDEGVIPVAADIDVAEGEAQGASQASRAP